MRYLIVSDIHANLAALQSVLNAAPSFDAIWCLGDLVGYGPNPNEVIERLQEFPFVSVMGNHDWASWDAPTLTSSTPTRDTPFCGRGTSSLLRTSDFWPAFPLARR